MSKEEKKIRPPLNFFCYFSVNYSIQYLEILEIKSSDYNVCILLFINVSKHSNYEFWPGIDVYSLKPLYQERTPWYSLSYCRT